MGVDSIGINFWQHSKRYCDAERASEIVAAIGSKVETVGIFVDAGVDEIQNLLRVTGIEFAQLHGDEPPEQLKALLPKAYKALRVKGLETLQEVQRFAGAQILLDAYAPQGPGGTGCTFDWSIAGGIGREKNMAKKITIAGGLNPENVAEAIRVARPHRVDVASGVESTPGQKDPKALQRFITAVREADRDHRSIRP